jgi:hypothetical protein
MRKAVAVAAALAFAVGCGDDSTTTVGGAKVPAAACDGWESLRDDVDRFPPTGDLRVDINSRGGQINREIFTLMAAAQDAAGITPKNAGSEEVKSHPLYALAAALGRLWQGRSAEQWPNDYFGSAKMSEDIAIIDRFCDAQ